MHKLTEISMKNRAFIALLTVVVAVLGIFSLSTLRQELIPSVELPQVSVFTVSPGATSEQMKERVSLPIEQQISTIPEVESTSTQSSSSLSMVTVELTYGTDLARATSKIELAVSRAKENFPEGAEPQVRSGGTGDIPLAYVAVTSDGDELTTAERIRTAVIPQLEKVDGVASVQLVGGVTQVVRISLNQAKIAELGIQTSAIQDALENNGLAVPVGTLVQGKQQFDVTVGKQLGSLDELRAVPVVAKETEVTLPDGTTAPGPAEVYPLSDIAQVSLVEGANTVRSRLDGKSAQALLISPTANANIVQTSEKLQDELDTLAASVGGNTKFTVLFDQAPFITQSVSSLAKEGALGLVFAVVVILLFLFSVRSTLITAISIPASLLVGFIGMLASGYSLNMLTLAALTLTIGRVVDDSIVVIENINRHLSYGKKKKRAILDAVSEVASAITASTVVSLIVFLPIAFVSGMVGEMFRPFALTTVMAMAASLFVALTIVPVLAYWFLKPSKAAREALAQGGEVAQEYAKQQEEREEKFWLRRVYRPALRVTQAHPWATLTAGVLVLGATVATFPLLNINLMGSMNQGMIFVTQKVDPGTPDDELISKASSVEEAVEQVDGVKSVATVIGAAALSGSSAGSDISYMVSVDTSLNGQEINDAVMNAAEGAAGKGMVSAADQSMIGSGTIDVLVTAPSPELLSEAAQTVAQDLQDVDGVERVDTNLQENTKAVQVTVNREAAASFGLTENEVVGFISAQMVEPKIGSITLDNIDTEIHLAISQPVQTVDELRAMTIMGQPITKFASVDEVDSVPTIYTNDGQTTATVQVTPAQADQLGAVTTAVEQQLAKSDLPDGAVTHMGGAAEQLQDSFSNLVFALLAAVLLIYVALVWIFKSLVQPLLLLISIPFAAIGAFLALLIMGTPLDISAMVGLLMLTGIVVTNAVVLIDLINQYRRRGDSIEDAIYFGAMRRLRPIIMTALATVAAMLPMALGFSESSGFLSQPLAVTVIGGLISSTFLTLVLLPVLYRLVEGAKQRLARR